MGSNHEKNVGRNSRDTLPLSYSSKQRICLLPGSESSPGIRFRSVTAELEGRYCVRDTALAVIL